LISRKPDFNYIGADIVKPLILNNQQRFQDKNTKFIHLDITKDPLPDVDLWLLRDCLIHLSFEDIFLVVDNFLKSNIPYLLTTTHSQCSINKDIPTGSVRSINLELPPFNFCSPQQYIDEDRIEGFPVRKLALWKRETLSNCLKKC